MARVKRSSDQRMKALLVTMLLTLAACGGGPSTATEQLNGSCPISLLAVKLRGTAPAGASCARAEDCAPSCCPCPSGDNTFLAAECTGTCAEDPCADVSSSEYCE